QVCSRQMVLSASTAAQTFREAPFISEQVRDEPLLGAIYEIAGTIARRSAKHSAEFLGATPPVVTGLQRSFSGGLPPSDFESSTPGDSPPPNDQLVEAAVGLARAFAEQAGGIAADAWTSLPVVTEKLDAEQTLRLMKRATDFLERGGAPALQVLVSGGE